MSTSNISATQYEQLQIKLSAKSKENELLQQQLARLSEDVEDLRQDKKYLRAHNDDLKGELARLRKELEVGRKEKEKYRALVKQLQGHVPPVLRAEDGSGTVKPESSASLKWNAQARAPSSSRQSRSPSLEVIDMDTEGPEDGKSARGESTQDPDVDLLALDPMRNGGDAGAVGGSSERDIQEPLTPASQTPGPSAKALGKRKQVDDDAPQPAKKAKPTPFTSLPEPPWSLRSKSSVASQSVVNEPPVLGPPVTPPNPFEAYPASLSRPQPLHSSATPACSTSQAEIQPPRMDGVQSPEDEPTPEPSVPSAHQKPVSSQSSPTPIPSAARDPPRSPGKDTPTLTTTEPPKAQSPGSSAIAPVLPLDSSGTNDVKPRPPFQPEEEEEEEEEAQRPNFKVKEEHALTLPASVVEAYLQDAPKYVINPPAQPVGIPRIVMRLSYGGSDQHLIQYIPEDKNPSGNGKRRCVYPMPDMNPAMPFMPGESGLLFASRPELVDDNKGPWSVFRREKKAMWVYLGEYQNTVVGKLTKEQFCWQKETVQNHWASLVSKKRSPKYSSMRARIALRKAGVLPVDDKKKESTLVLEEQEKTKCGKGHPVSEKDILDAFRRGDEGIDILRMKCVGYDHVFIDHISQQFKKFKEDKVTKQRDQEKRMLPANHPGRAAAGLSAAGSALSTPIPGTSVSTRMTRSRTAATSQQASTAVSQPPAAVVASPGPSAPPRVTRSQKAHNSMSISTSKPRAPAPSTPVTTAQSSARARPPVSAASSTTSESAVALELQVGPDPSPESSSSRCGVSSRIEDNTASAALSTALPESDAGVSNLGLGSSSALKSWDWTRVYSWDGEKAIAQRAEEEEEEEEEEERLAEPVDTGDAEPTVQSGYESDGGLSYTSCAAEDAPPLPPPAPAPAPVAPVVTLGVTTRSRGRRKLQDADSGYLSAQGKALSDVSDLTDLDDL